MSELIPKYFVNILYYWICVEFYSTHVQKYRSIYFLELLKHLLVGASGDLLCRLLFKAGLSAGQLCLWLGQGFAAHGKHQGWGLPPAPWVPAPATPHSCWTVPPEPPEVQLWLFSLPTSSASTESLLSEICQQCPVSSSAVCL